MGKGQESEKGNKQRPLLCGDIKGEHSQNQLVRNMSRLLNHFGTTIGNANAILDQSG